MENGKISTMLNGSGTRTTAMDSELFVRNRRMADEKTLQNLEARLTRIEGQIRGIRNMTAEGRLCVDIVTQIAAVRAALKKVADIVVADHVQQWLKKTVSQDGLHGEQDVEELLKVFNQYYR